jgi:lipoate-protein ligase A
MKWLDLSLDSPPDNLALDEALLLAAEHNNGPEVLRVWESAVPCVVLGAGCALSADVNEEACLTDNVPILRRGSGGGTVLLTPGCLLFSVIFAYGREPALRQIGSSYCYILKRICAALAVPGLQPAGVSDLAIDDKKVSGNAQQRKRNHLLHHGTLLYDFDPALSERYLRMPTRQPPYRQQRTDASFLSNLPMKREEIVSRLRQTFGAELELTDWPKDEMKRLVASKYEVAEWISRR